LDFSLDRKSLSLLGSQSGYSLVETCVSVSERLLDSMWESMLDSMLEAMLDLVLA